MIVAQVFTAVFYQPLFNILIFFYWMLGFLVENADMGMAVILLTILVRVILLPMSLAGDKTEKDRRQIAKEVKDIEQKYIDEPDKLRKATKQVFRRSRSVVIGEMFSLGIQVAIALSLWQIFAKGLTGSDLHLIYPFMPEVDFPYNLNFLGHYSLNEPHWQMNVFQSLLIFILETISLYTSPYPVSKNEVVRMQLTLPLVSFLIFSMMPAGKKLFVIVTLMFSIVLTIVKYIRRKFLDYKYEAEEKEKAELAGEVPEEKIVVDVKS